jgi:glycine betaine/choline ABC-type transport system substrate-binding protein
MIVVGSKIDTEGAWLGNMILALLESRGMAAESKLRTRSLQDVRQTLRDCDQAGTSLSTL